MSKKAGNQNRKKGSDKRKNTFNKYGKNTTRGMRIKQTELENTSKNKGPVKKEGPHIVSIKKGIQQGKTGGKRPATMYKITCRDKKRSGK